MDMDLLAHLGDEAEALLRKEKKVFSTDSQQAYWETLQILADHYIPQRGVIRTVPPKWGKTGETTLYQVFVKREDFERAMRWLQEKRGSV